MFTPAINAFPINITNFPNYFSTQINLTLFYKDKINQLKKILETLTKENKKIIVNNYELPEIRFNSLFAKTHDELNMLSPLFSMAPMLKSSTATIINKSKSYSLL